MFVYFVSLKYLFKQGTVFVQLCNPNIAEFAPEKKCIEEGVKELNIYWTDTQY